MGQLVGGMQKSWTSLIEQGSSSGIGSEARGGNPVHYGCSLSSMSYMTFALIAIYTAINVNNNINNNNNNNNNNSNNNNNKNENMNKRKKRKANINKKKEAADLTIVRKLIQRPQSDLDLAFDV